MKLLRRADNWWARHRQTIDGTRIDLNFANMSMLVGLMLPSLSIVLTGPVPTSALADMPTSLQITMCACIFVGCAMKLHGALAARRFWFPNMSLKRCYQFGYSGAPMVTMGCLVYGWFLLHNTPNFWSALGAVSTPIFGIGMGAQAVLYWLEARRIEHNERAAIAQWHAGQR